MKKLSLFCFFLFCLFACKNDDENICDETLQCADEACLFTIDNMQGSTLFIPCFDSWGIHVQDSIAGWSQIYVIPDDLDSSYKKEGVQVTLCGYVRDNTLPLILPDPGFGPVYQIRLEGIE